MEKIETLKKNYEFKNVITKGKCFVKSQIIVYIKKNNVNKNLIGIAIGGKIGNAVKRNFLKRKIRECYRKLAEELIPGNDIVFLWNKKTLPENAYFKLIEKEMKNIFCEAKIIKENVEN